MPVGSDEDSEDPFALLDRVGRVPLPPYIRGGKMVDSDVENYQTVFAKHRGAVAAPTAGLHFTADLLKQLSGGGINLSAVTLHVGRDTFKPIATNRLSEHSMHSEWASVSEKTAKEIEETKVSGGRIIAVGTTVVRTLETAAKSGKVQSFTGQTDLFIKPPYEFRAVDALITNFHLPRTTLLVLARTFGGDELIEQAYVEAVAEHYRFYSYGDTMLIV